MSSASEDSPSTWRKPSDIMRLRRKRKSSVNSSPRPPSQSSPLSSPNTPSESLLPSWRKPGQKRRNPFGCSPSKRRNSSNRMEGEEHADASPLLGILSGTQNEDDKEQIAPAVDQSRTQNLDDILAAPIGKQKPENKSMKKEELDPVVQRERSCPIDWSLKTRARFVSPKPFSWCTPLRTTDESAGVAAFTHSIPDNVTNSVQDPSRCEHSKREFQKHTLYWQHPNLPWLRLCPRIVPDHKIGKVGSWIINDDIQAALMSDWSASFNSAFNQLRGGRCPYFYLCAHSFTVLFRAGGLGRRPGLHAILSPTSRGLRELLKKEGIEFTMPLAGNFAAKSENIDAKPAKDMSTADGDDRTPERPEDCTQTGKEAPSTEVQEDDIDDDDITATDDGATSFLETLGLDAGRYRSLDPSKIKLQRETFKEIDHRPESMVVVDGSDTQAMFNFLLNCRSCVASSGIQTGIPPTILAPVPFKGASLKCLKYKTGTVRQASAQDGNASLWHSLEIEGAILPHTFHGLTRLFSHTQGDYRATFSTHDATAPLNAAPPAEDGEAGDVEKTVASLSKTGVQPSHIEDIVKECTLGKMVVRDVECQDGLFTWGV